MDTYFNLADIFRNRGEMASAIKILEKARMFHPANDIVHLRLGMAYLEASRLDEAKLAVEQSLGMNPASGMARQVLAEIMRKLKRKKGGG